MPEPLFDYSPRVIDVTDPRVVEAADILMRLNAQANKSGDKLTDPTYSEEDQRQAHDDLWSATDEALALLEKFGPEERNLLNNAAMGVVTLHLVS